MYPRDNFISFFRKMLRYDLKEFFVKAFIKFEIFQIDLADDYVIDFWY